MKVMDIVRHRPTGEVWIVGGLLPDPPGSPVLCELEGAGHVFQLGGSGRVAPIEEFDAVKGAAETDMAKFNAQITGQDSACDETPEHMAAAHAIRSHDAGMRARFAMSCPHSI